MAIRKPWAEQLAYYLVPELGGFRVRQTVYYRMAGGRERISGRIVALLPGRTLPSGRVLPDRAIVRWTRKHARAVIVLGKLEK